MIFGTFERMVAFRYLRARRQEGFVSVIAIFSLLGIALGVATLIIVMSVMNGFRADLIGRILGLNGHLGVYGAAATMPDFDAVAAKVRAVPGVTEVTPLVEGQVMATSPAAASGALVRGIRPDDLADLARRHRNRVRHHAAAQDLYDRRAVRCRLLRIRQQLHLRAAGIGANLLQDAEAGQLSGGVRPRRR
jgi:lipoprotein-releasing system permease protein